MRPLPPACVAEVLPLLDGLYDDIINLLLSTHVSGSDDNGNDLDLAAARSAAAAAASKAQSLGSYRALESQLESVARAVASAAAGAGKSNKEFRNGKRQT